MFNKTDISAKRKTLMIYIALVLVITAVFWQAHRFDFIDLDDFVYVSENLNIQSGITADSIRWAFGTTYADFWHPLTWLSLMADYDVYSLQAGGYHITNLIFHILSALLLFWLFHRMTGEIWKSAFVSAFFALHPLHVESVAWVSERKDVLSAFFWMLTLCFYVVYTEKPNTKRYLPVLFCFTLALMSKPMVVTLPVIMVLLDYWPLKRFQNKESLSKLFLWQVKEKLPLLILSAVFSVITVYAQHDSSGAYFPLMARLVNAPVAFALYLIKTFLPHNLAVFYPFPSHYPLWQVIGGSLLILAVTIFVILKAKRSPYLLVGWLWFTIILLPVIGILQVGNHAMADRYMYLPLIGIGIMLSWGIPHFFADRKTGGKILFPAALVFLLLLTLLTWKQCGYWKNSKALFHQALKTTTGNYIAHGTLGVALLKEGQIEKAIDHLNKAIQIRPDYYKPYDSRGVAYDQQGQYEQAITDFSTAIRFYPEYAVSYNNRAASYDKSGQYQKALEDYRRALLIKPDYADAYNNRGIIFARLGRHQKAIEDFSKAIALSPAFIDAYNNRVAVYAALGQYDRAIQDLKMAVAVNPDHLQSYINMAALYGKLNQYDHVVKSLSETIRLRPSNALFYFNRGLIYAKTGRYPEAIHDFDKAVSLKANYADAYNTRAAVHFNQRNMASGCMDARKACELGNCATLHTVAEKGLCR